MVITADLFRFLTLGGAVDAELDQLLPEIPVHFFSMGCPLRQLYRLRFPYLYKWVGTSARNAETDPEKMGLASWTNAYRSGDYIGRHLWCDDALAKLWDCNPAHESNKSGWVASDIRIKPIWDDPPTNRREFCVGPGAHQQYRDGEAACTDAELDHLICT